MMTAAANEALYLFYLTGSGYFQGVQGTGIDEAECLFVHRHAGLLAVLCKVTLDDYRGPEGERRLSDLGWVSERALRHERVIEHGFRRGPVLPARFGTLFSSTQAVEHFLEKNQRTIADFLDTVRGQEEWGIKALLERSAARKWLSAQMSAAASGTMPPSPGLRYIQERRAEAAAEKELRRWLLEACDSVARSLDKYATGLRQRKVLESAVPGDSRELVLNLATLVPRDRLEGLVSHIEGVNSERSRQGLRFMLNGPWPPYSFCPPLMTP